jgi:hypothetical protein
MGHLNADCQTAKRDGGMNTIYAIVSGEKRGNIPCISRIVK